MHECSITVVDERLNGGRPTNIPLVVPGQACPGPGQPLSREQEERAIAHAAKTGKHLGAFESIEEAVRAARERSAQAHPAKAGQTRPASEPSPQNGGPKPQGLIPLGEAIEQALGAGRQAAPADTAPLLEGLRAPVFPLEGARRFEPTRMTDVQPMGTDLERDTLDFTRAGPGVPRPFELLTPREAETMQEALRIGERLSDAPAERGATARRR